MPRVKKPTPPALRPHQADMAKELAPFVHRFGVQAFAVAARAALLEAWPPGGVEVHHELYTSMRELRAAGGVQ